MLYLTSLCHSLCLIAQLCPTVCNPMDCSPPGSSVHGDSLRKNTGVGCHAFLQGILPTQGLNPGLLHCRQIPYHLSHWEPSLRLLIQDLKGWHHQGITFNMSANLESPAVVIGLEKVNPHRSTKECANHQTTALIPHASKVMLKISHARLQYYVNQELPDVQTGFRKGRGIRDQMANNHWTIEKAKDFQKKIYLCFTDYAKAFDWVDLNEPWNTLNEMEYQTNLPVSWETCMRVKKQQSEPCMEQLMVQDWETSVTELSAVTLCV